MPVRALLVDGFGTVLDWSGPFSTVNENALRRALSEADSVTRLPPFSDFRVAFEHAREEERRAKDATLEERDYRARFVNVLLALGTAKRQARVLGDRMCTRYFRELEAAIRLAPDALDFFRALPDEGLKLALVTNYGDGLGLRRALGRLDVLFRFESIVVSGDVGFLKPHPALVSRALADLDVPAEDALMVGDRVDLDVAGAAACGVRAVLVANPRAGLRDTDATPQPEDARAVARLEDLTTLPGLLASL